MENEENDFPRTDRNRPRSTTCVSTISTGRNIHSIESLVRRVFAQPKPEAGLPSAEYSHSIPLSARVIVIPHSRLRRRKSQHRLTVRSPKSHRDREALGGVEGDRSLKNLPSHVEIAAHDLEHWCANVHAQFARHGLRCCRCLYLLLDLGDASAITRFDQ